MAKLRHKICPLSQSNLMKIAKQMTVREPSRPQNNRKVASFCLQRNDGRSQEVRETKTQHVANTNSTQLMASCGQRGEDQDETEVLRFSSQSLSTCKSRRRRGGGTGATAPPSVREDTLRAGKQNGKLCFYTHTQTQTRMRDARCCEL